MKSIGVEFRNAYNIDILPQLLLFDIAYNLLSTTHQLLQLFLYLELYS